MVRAPRSLAGYSRSLGVRGIRRSMSQLFLVRHGQASFLADDYDELSQLGREQARQLGEYWARCGVRVHRALAGPRRRQQDTAQICLSALGYTGPELVVEPAFDEHPGEFLMRECLPAALAVDPVLGERMHALAAAADRPARARAMELALQRVMALWLAGSFDTGALETWQCFRARLQRALTEVTATQSGGQAIAVFSSGGSIGALVGLVMGVQDEAALELGYSVQNASVSELRFSRGGRVSLSRFNSLAHLPDPQSWTYR